MCLNSWFLYQIYLQKQKICIGAKDNVLSAYILVQSCQFYILPNAQQVMIKSYNLDFVFYLIIIPLFSWELFAVS